MKGYEIRGKQEDLDNAEGALEEIGVWDRIDPEVAHFIPPDNSHVFDLLKAYFENDLEFTEKEFRP